MAASIYGKDCSEGAIAVNADEYSKLTFGMEEHTFRDMSTSLAGSTFENESLKNVGTESDCTINGLTADEHCEIKYKGAPVRGNAP